MEQKKQRNRQRHIIKCNGCNNQFSVNSTQLKTKKYCSKKCMNECNYKTLTCCVCKSNFIRKQWQINSSKKASGIDSNQYCSKQCYNNRQDDIFVKCDGCKKNIKIFNCQKKYYDKHYCSKGCCVKFGPIGKLTENTIVDNAYHRFTRSFRKQAKYLQWRRQILDRDNNSCVCCGSSQKLTVHHKYVSMYDFCKKHNFDKNKIYEDCMFFDIKNGQTLCRKCHAKQHRK